MSHDKKEDLFYAHIGSVLNEEFDASFKEKYPQSFKEPELSRNLENFRKARGRLQNVLSGQFFSDNELIHIRSFTQNMQPQQLSEQQAAEQEIALHETTNIRRRRVRQALVYGVILFALYGIGRNFVPQPLIDFDPVKDLAHEAQALEARYNERLELQSNNADDVREFFLNYPKFEWSDNMLRLPASRGWALLGASVLDYEIVKISAVAYSRPLAGKDILEEEVETISDDGLETRIEVVRRKIPRKDILVHFSFESSEDYLPSSLDPTQYKSIQYYTYVSDDYNIIMWRHLERYNLILGRIAPTEMVTFVP